MKNAEFIEIVREQIQTCLDILDVKRDDYDGVEADRFNAFKRAAMLQNESPIRALGGMMAKHTTSIYDMIEGGQYSMEKWTEKITDHINYLLLLKALVKEESSNE